MQFYGSMKVIIIVYYTVLLEDTFGLLNLDHLVLSSRPPRQRLHVDLLACLCCWGLLLVASKELTLFGLKLFERIFEVLQYLQRL